MSRKEFRTQQDLAWWEWGFVAIFVVGILLSIISFVTYKAFDRAGSDGQNWLVIAIIESCVAVVCLGFWLWLVRHNKRERGDQSGKLPGDCFNSDKW